MSVEKAICMYNLIMEIEERINSGEYIEDIDIPLMQETKKLAKSVIERELNVQVV